MASTTQLVQAAAEGNGDVKGGYWLSDNPIPTSHIPTSLFTHIYYASLIPNKDTFILEPSDKDKELIPDFIKGIKGKFKALISIGHGGDSEDAATILAEMASKAKNRKAFIDSSILLARQYWFDGLDLDWEFPKNQKEMDDFQTLLQEWRKAVNEEAEKTNEAALLLTAKVYYDPQIKLPDPSYDPVNMAMNLDWINVMCYNNNPAFKEGLKDWIDKGMPNYMLVMGFLYDHETVESVTLKIGYAKILQLRGYFFWNISLDYPGWALSTAAKKAWDNGGN